MNALPYYKRFPRDFLEGTVGIPFEEKGAYGLVLDLIFLQNGSLADDSGYIAGNLGMSVRKWNSIRSKLIIRGKLRVKDGFISTSRSDDLTLETSKLRDKNAKNGPKAHKNKNLAGANADKARILPEPESDKEEERTTTTKTIELEAEPEKAGGGGLAMPDISIQIRLNKAVGPAAEYGFHDMLEAQRWTDDLGLSISEQEHIIAEVMGTVDAPPNSLKFFSKAMQRGAGRKSQSPLAPVTSTGQPQPDFTLEDVFNQMAAERDEQRIEAAE